MQDGNLLLMRERFCGIEQLQQLLIGGIACRRQSWTLGTGSLKQCIQLGFNDSHEIKVACSASFYWQRVHFVPINTPASVTGLWSVDFHTGLRMALLGLAALQSWTRCWGDETVFDRSALLNTISPKSTRGIHTGKKTAISVSAFISALHFRLMRRASEINSICSSFSLEIKMRRPSF